MRYGYSYQFKSGSGFRGDAESVCKELERVRKENDGQLRPANVVEAASNQESPLYPHFEWDDRIAAHEHRKSTARKLIRSVVIVPEAQESTEMKPAYINVKSEDKGQYYQSIESARPDEFESAIEGFKRKLRQLKESLAQVEHAAETEDQIEKVGELRQQTENLESVL